jgi:hypothetical protein
MPIQTIDGFSVNTTRPIDTRIVTTDRNAIVFKYDGLRVFDTTDRKAYVWNINTNSWEWELSVALRNSEGSGAVNRIALFDSNTTLRGSIMTQTANTGIIVNGTLNATTFNGNIASSFITGVLSVSQGGTGLSSVGTVNRILLTGANNSYSFVTAPSANNSFLNWNNGFNWTSSLPTTVELETSSTNSHFLTFVDDTGNKNLKINNGLSYIPSTNRLGIGTSNPFSKLHISDTLIGSTVNFLVGASGTISPGNYTSHWYLDNIGLKFGHNSTDRDIQFQTGVTNAVPSTRMTISSTGNVGIGTSTPLSNLHINGNLLISGAASNGLLPGISFAETGLVGISGILGTKDSQGRIGLIFFNTDSSQTLNSIFVISPLGNVSIYGDLTFRNRVAVTQVTTRFFGVTINASSGSIQLFSSAGSTTSYTTFTVSNSRVSSTDTIIVNQKSGTNIYNFMVTNIDNGYFIIKYISMSGTATDSPVINFTVIKSTT